MRGAALPAAVFPADDHQAVRVARAVPVEAQVQRLGECMLGYTVAPTHSATVAPRQRFSLLEMEGRGRRKALRRLIQHRRENGVIIDDTGAWSAIVADIAACIFGPPMTLANVEGQAVFLSLDLDREMLAPFAAAWAARRRAAGDAFKPISSAELGRLIRLDWREKEELKLHRILAFNETTAQRRRRRNKERMAQKRAQSRPVKTPKPWEALGISKATFYRRETKSVGVSLKEGKAHKNSLISGNAHHYCLTFGQETHGGAHPHGKRAQKQSQLTGAFLGKGGDE